MEEQIFNIYIDEAGDEGFKFESNPKGGSSHFFVLSALIVHESKDRELASLTTELKHMLNYQLKDIHSPLHFYKLNHDRRKACVNKLVSFDDFTTITVVFEKHKLNSNLKITPYLYNYACRLLLERVEPFLKAHSAKANLIFEHRRNTGYKELEVYINNVVDTSRYLTMSPKPKAQSKCLQLADIIASSIYQAFEPNQYDGDVEPAFIYKLQNKIFCHNNKCLGYGLKLFPTDTDLIEQEKYEWINIMLQKIYEGLK